MKKLSLVSAMLLITPVFGFFSSESASAAAGVYSFTTAGSSGINGPIQESVTAAYSGTTLAGQVVIQTRGIQQWTVPVTDTYSVTAAGASGGYVTGKIGGRGRVITTQIYLTQGQVLKILIGQEGGRSAFTLSGGGASGGGGGGTFIVDSATSSALLVVGGGGGGAISRTGLTNAGGSDGLDASAYNVTAGVAGTGGGAGGTLGGGGVTTGSWCAGGGGGFTGDGSTWNSTYGVGGKSFSNGGVGGANFSNAGTTLNIPGGFGGGGGSLAMDNYETNGGGGGGYSGGGCGRNAQNNGGGGGGGNFYTGIYISNSLNTGHGYATFSRMNLAAAQIILSSNSSTTTRNISVLTATSNAPGVITFYANGKRIAGCISIKTQVSGPNNIATCNWKPSVRGSTAITAQISPTDIFGLGTSQATSIAVAGRSGNR